MQQFFVLDFSLSVSYIELTIANLEREHAAMGSQSTPESIQELFHKKKESNKKQYAKGQSPIDQLDNRTIGEGSTQGYETQEAPAPEVEGLLHNRNEAKSRTRNQIINFEIDEFLFNLLNEGLIEAEFVSYYAKACHTLGIPMVNRLAINARNGNQPTRLFAYKVKGALQLHYKQLYLNS